MAHAEGRFVTTPDVLEELARNGQIVYRYVDPDGNPAGYPHNPNGSFDNIAGICDPTGCVLGLMPHPERFVYPYHHPRWTREGLRDEADGLTLFRNAVASARNRRAGASTR